jgi:hypothetical protein
MAATAAACDYRTRAQRLAAVSAYELWCRAAYVTEYATAIDIRELSGELAVEPTSAHRGD